MTYAARTEVSVDKTKAEIEKLLARYGATSFASGWSPEGATIVFEAKARRIRFELPMPKQETFRSVKKWEQEQRRRWRCLALMVKSKLEAVESGIVSFEEEFLAHIVVPGRGETFGQWVRPQLAEAYAGGKAMPPLLGAGGAQ